MSETDLFGRYRQAMNDELGALGCGLRIAAEQGAGSMLLILDADGRRLGWLPDTVDAATLAAVETIIEAAALRATSPAASGTTP